MRDLLLLIPIFDTVYLETFHLRNTTFIKWRCKANKWIRSNIIYDIAYDTYTIFNTICKFWIDCNHMFVLIIITKFLPFNARNPSLGSLTWMVVKLDNTSSRIHRRGNQPKKINKVHNYQWKMYAPLLSMTCCQSSGRERIPLSQKSWVFWSKKLRRSILIWLSSLNFFSLK